MRLRWTNLASADLEHIEQHIAKENPLAALDVVLRVIEKLELILLSHPAAGRMGRVEGTRELVLNGLPFVVVYREFPGEVQILRVLNDSQQWPPMQGNQR